MRIILITQGLSKLVLSLNKSSHDLVSILESGPRSSYTSSKRVKIKSTLKEIFSNFNHSYLTLKTFCKKEKILYKSMVTISDSDLKTWIRELTPDIIVIYSMSKLLKKKIYEIPKYGTINLHPSYLPEYRGPNPFFWQYYYMELNPGVTIHFIDDGEDTGDVIYQSRITIPKGIKFEDLNEILINKVGLELLFKTLSAIEKGVVIRRAQNCKPVFHKARNLFPEEHKVIIKWNEWPIERIWHVLRGTEKWLNALDKPPGIYRRQKWIIEEYKKEEGLGLSTQKIYKENGQYFVACRDGKIYLSVMFCIKELVSNLLSGKNV